MTDEQREVSTREDDPSVVRGIIIGLEIVFALWLIAALTIVIAIVAFAPGHAQTPAGQTVVAPSGFVPAQAVCTTSTTGKAVCPPALPTSDANSAPFSNEVAMTVGGAAVPATRSVKIRCTAAGSATFSLAGGTSSTWDVGIGTQTLPISATTVTASTGTCTFAGVY